MPLQAHKRLDSLGAQVVRCRMCPGLCSALSLDGMTHKTSDMPPILLHVDPPFDNSSVHPLHFFHYRPIVRQSNATQCLGEFILHRGRWVRIPPQGQKFR